jgi:hydrogenase/urease accessory protein HupE
MNFKSIAATSVLFSPLAHAHPGEHHGGILNAIAHLLSEPDHLAMALFAVVLGVLGARLYHRRAQTRNHNKTHGKR